jgi:hypothetical protein
MASSMQWMSVQHENMRTVSGDRPEFHTNRLQVRRPEFHTNRLQARRPEFRTNILDQGN